MKENMHFDSNCLLDVAFQTMLKNSRDMIFVKDTNSVYVAASQPFVKMVGKDTEAQLLGKTKRKKPIHICVALKAAQFFCIRNKNKPPAMQVCSPIALALGIKKPPMVKYMQVRQPHK